MHADDDALWALARGEDVPLRGSSSAGAHVAGCPRCTEELAGRRRVLDAARRPPPADLPLRPHPRVLEAVRAELGLTGPPARAARGPEGGRRAAVAGLPLQADGAHDGEGARRGGPGRRGAALLAALVGVVLGLGAGAGAVRLTGPDPEGAPPPAAAAVVVARAVLEPVDGTGVRGAAVLRDAGGTQELEVDVDRADAPPGGYQEVWLLDAASGGLLSLGALADGHGVFTVPPGALGEGRQVQVDVSEEPLDGQPTHSGASLARGPLEG
ncbi:anti-sigma factor [uncultured Pseudokineococcus sp.]|uniref:anti-sigma factor n=1 Tax=uncultured Pseudokineococcus sp. TaxID=1642928 RepID=UPI0026088A1C|nr:anti-sigma factor [uncultured Pseudokineococcus sp.]